MKSPTRQSKRKASRRGEVRARKMWANPNLMAQYMDFTVYHSAHTGAAPVFVLPADAESVERMREQVAQSLRRSQHGWLIGECRFLAGRVMKSLTLTPTSP